jgi:hypothetical protein
MSDDCSYVCYSSLRASGYELRMAVLMSTALTSGAALLGTWTDRFICMQQLVVPATVVVGACSPPHLSCHTYYTQTSVLILSVPVVADHLCNRRTKLLPVVRNRLPTCRRACSAVADGPSGTPAPDARKQCPGPCHSGRHCRHCAEARSVSDHSGKDARMGVVAAWHAVTAVGALRLRRLSFFACPCLEHTGSFHANG